MIIEYIKSSTRFIRSKSGFTLIEIIVGLIIFSVMGSMLVSMGITALTKNAQLVGLTRNTYSLKTVMENINSDYMSMINPDTAGSSILDDLFVNLNTANFYHASYNYTVAMTRFNTFVPDANNDLVQGPEDRLLGAIMRVTISDPSGMTLTALFFDNNI